MATLALILAVLVPLLTTVALLVMLGRQQKMIEALQLEVKGLRKDVSDLENVQLMLSEQIKARQAGPLGGLAPLLGAAAKGNRRQNRGPMGLILLFLQLITAYLKRKESMSLPTKKDIGGQHG
ncbi:MAG TPA: hypothetical protein PLO61_05840 [Fimbriimonadaceae bacterium]|nr:hypothetical protein [Fimbriimonadaceae bacterium]HRJ33360.1 hypothetical protein [Fimbriimonadaceae bacterium]